MNKIDTDYTLIKNQMLNSENTERLAREKDWNNKRFENGTREKVVKYYSVGITYTLLNHLFAELKSGNSFFLEYGCGTGYYLTSISNKIKKGVGIDISDVSIEKARRIAEESSIKNIDFFVMDAMNTTFSDEEFDMIHGKAILHHLDLKLSLIEIKRILKKDGKAIFLEPLDTNPVIKLYRKLTPKARTADEQPLRIKDIKIIKKIFPSTEIYYYSFLTLFSVPFRNTKLFPKILNILSFLDKIILNKYSPFKWLAWICILIMKR